MRMKDLPLASVWGMDHYPARMFEFHIAQGMINIG
jgi:hypothetical protein